MAKETTTPEPVEEPDELSAEDEALLDSIWDNIAAEEKENNDDASS